MQLDTAYVHKRTEYKSDMRAHGLPELFQAPDRTIETGIGDCEDHAFLICAIARGLPKNLRPALIRTTVGWYQSGITMGFHAWCNFFIDGVGEWMIAEGTKGVCYTYPQARLQGKNYKPKFSLLPTKIILHGL